MKYVITAMKYSVIILIIFFVYMVHTNTDDRKTKNSKILAKYEAGEIFTCENSSNYNRYAISKETHSKHGGNFVDRRTGKIFYLDNCRSW